MTSWNERILAAMIPVLGLAACAVTITGLFIVPILGYFIAKKCKYDFTADNTLRFFDFLVSIFMILFLVGMFNSGLVIAAQDSGVTIPFVSSGLLKDIIKYIGILYLIVGCILYVIFSIFSKSLSMPLSLKIFEKLRGKISNSNRQGDEKDVRLL